MSAFFPAVSKLCSEPAEPDEIFVAMQGDALVVSGGGRLPNAAEWRIDCERLLIGRLGESLCSLLSTAESELPAVLELVDVRRALTFLPEPEQIAVCRARELAFWRKLRKFCGGCGHVLVDLADECARKCPECGAVFYPQISPAVIVAITDADGRLLLAHNSKFRDGLYSLIAGFVEPGETMESAVHREIREEVGIEVKNIRYFGSQSWPYPNSLMVGFTAEYAGGEIRPDGAEITDAGFFFPDEAPEIPSPGSIARKLIDHWLNKECI